MSAPAPETVLQADKAVRAMSAIADIVLGINSIPSKYRALAARFAVE